MTQVNGVDLFNIISYTCYMNKWQIIDYIYWNLDGLNETELWRLVDLISDQQAIEMMDRWLYSSSAPGQIHIQAQGIIEWHHLNGFITARQRRWLVLAMVSNWASTDADLHNSLPI